MNDERIREEEFQTAAVGDPSVGQESSRNQMSNDELRELLHQHVGIL